MLRFSPCVEMFWPDAPFVERVRRVATLGFDAYEFWSWWDKDLDALELTAQDNGLIASACCVRTAFTDPATPSLLVPEGREPFMQAVRDCVDIHKRLSCQSFIVTTGNVLPEVSAAAQHAACVAALKAAAPIAEDAGFMLVLEPLNTLVDHAGYYLSSAKEGFEIVDEVSSPAVKLLFDIYHMHVMGGNLTPQIVPNIGKIGHVHVANHPGRHEPMLGEINYPYVFDRIAAAGYDRYVGLEFKPSDPDLTSSILGHVLTLP
ncbi:MAG TPA: TIM barrel protein [Candidatus Hydrogenedentes bacterium]|nr:TIM barrel protein [Candidatus Hydrogenedentota bacterium]